MYIISSCLYINKGVLILCSDSYSIEDTIRLINVLIIKFRLECTLRAQRKNQYRIYIQQGSMASLLNIVSPYFHYSMLYKIYLSKPVKTIRE